MNVQHYSVKQGLPNNKVNFTFQDKNGYIWIGTNVGLSKFNGYQFKNFIFDPNEDNAIQVGQYESFIQISDTIYYLATFSDGLVQLNILTDQIVKIKNSPSNIATIFKDKDASLWLGSFSSGIFHYFPKTNKFEQTLLMPLLNDFYEDLENNSVTAILKDNNNDSNLWLGTRIGLFSFNKITKKMLAYPVKSNLPQKESAFNLIISMCADNAGNIWAGCLKGGGLGKFNIKNKIWNNYIFNQEDANKKGYRSNTVTNILLYSNTTLLLSTDIGLLSFDVSKNEFKKYVLKNDLEIDPYTSHLMIDKDFNWWISHQYSGLCYISSKQNAIRNIQLPPQKFKPDENNSVILDFYFSKRHQKYFVLNTNHDGLTIYDTDFKLLEQVTLAVFNEKREPFPISMGEDDKGMIWINEKSDKLFVYNPVRKEVENHENSNFSKCYKIYRSNNNCLYFKTEKGLFRFKNKEWKLEINLNSKGNKPFKYSNIGLVSNIKKSFLLFAASNDSIFRFDLISKKNTFEFQLPDFAVKNGNYICQIYVDRKDKIWLPMRLGGVYKYDSKTKKGLIYAAKKGLSSNTAQMLKEDKNGTLFLIGRNGLYFYNQNQDRFIDFGKLSSNTNQDWYRECLFFTEKDEMLLCKTNEFSIIDKNIILKNINKTNPIITYAYGNNFDLSNISNQINIPNYENDITLVLSNFDFDYSSELVYSYKIDNQNWIDLDKGLNKISLNNLSEGTHFVNFKILGNSKFESCTIIVNLIWYKSKYFYWVVGFLILALSIYFIWFFVNKKTKERELQKRISELKLCLLQSQLNPHFLFNCLTSISGLIKTKLYDTAEIILNDFAKLMRSILLNSNKDLISLEEELKISKQYLDIEKVRKNNTFDYEITIAKNIDTSMLVPPLVLQPFLENCIKHGFVYKTMEDKGLIEIKISKENHSQIIEIKDNGVGLFENINPLNSHQSMGIEIQKERLQQYEKTHQLKFNISINFRAKEGTIVKIVSEIKNSI